MIVIKKRLRDSASRSSAPTIRLPKRLRPSRTRNVHHNEGRNVQMIFRYCLAIGLIFAVPGRAALADPAQDSQRFSAKSPPSSRTLPPTGTTTYDAPVPDEGHSFSGFYGGLQGGLATGHDATYGTSSHP
jgi:hypothetical protein